jgi:hypothetical protein
MTAQNTRGRLPTKFSFRNKFASLKEHKKLCRNPNFYNFWTKSSNFLRVSEKTTFIKICKFRHFLCDFSSFSFCYGLIFGVPRISFIYFCKVHVIQSYSTPSFFDEKYIILFSLRRWSRISPSFFDFAKFSCRKM